MRGPGLPLKEKDLSTLGGGGHGWEKGDGWREDICPHSTIAIGASKVRKGEKKQVFGGI